MMTNRIAFVSGASRGIGRACAVELSRAGARVVLAARDRARLEETAAMMEASPVIVTMDQADAASIKEAFAKAVASACHAEGVVVLTCGTHGNVVRLLPPLVIADDVLDEGLGVLEAAITDTAITDTARSHP